MKKLGVMLAAALIAGAIGSVAGAAQGEKVTGGGQIEFDTQTTGAGNTIAFTIQDDGTVKGQFQYVDRTTGNGQDQDSWHGTPTCLQVELNTAKAVISRNDTGAVYELFIQDNGQGQDPADMVTLSNADASPDPECDGEQDDNVARTELGRGNTQVEDNE